MLSGVGIAGFPGGEENRELEITSLPERFLAGIRRATRVIAVSEYARRGAIEHGGADPDLVDVTPLGVDHARFRPAAESELAQDERADADGIAGQVQVRSIPDYEGEHPVQPGGDFGADVLVQV